MSDSDEAVYFGRAVRRQRYELGISQEELADRAALHRTYISDVELGLRNLSIKSIAKLARALNLSIPSLFAQADVNAASERSVEILLIEDNPHDVELTLRAFWRAKISNVVNVARDGEEGLEYLFPKDPSRGHPLPGVILLDLYLPKINGFEVLRRIKLDPKTQNIPVVVLTVSDRETDIAECRRLGARNYIVKPVSFRNFSDVTPALDLQWALQRPLQELAE